MFKECLSMSDDDLDSDAIQPDVLMRLILHYKIGGYGREFFSVYLNKRKAKFIAKNKKKWSIVLSLETYSSIWAIYESKVNYLLSDLRHRNG